MNELRCPFCNSGADGPTALREHLLACEDFTTAYGSPFGSVSIRDLESAMRESDRVVASVGWWYGKIRELIEKAKPAAVSGDKQEKATHAPWCNASYGNTRMSDDGEHEYRLPCNCGGRWNA